MEKNALTPLLKNESALILAYDHGMEHGPSDFEGKKKLADPERVFRIAEHEDVTALAVGKGLAETYYNNSENVNLLLKLNGTTSLKKGSYFSPKNCTVERAVELGADAVGYTLYPGSEMEERMFEDLRTVQENARKHDVPVVVWAYPRGSEINDDTEPEVVSYGARIGLELGADMVKVKYPGSEKGMESVIDVCGEMPAVVSGGSMKEDSEFLGIVGKAFDSGAKGMAVGRNIWKRESPENIIEAIGDIIYRERSPEEAVERMG